MILETLLSSVDNSGDINLAPMGIAFDGDTVLIKTYSQSHTHQNLQLNRECVINISDNIYHFLLATLSDPRLDFHKANKIRGYYLADCCQYYEIQITRIDNQDKCYFYGSIINHQQLKAFRGYNRAQNLLLEALIRFSRLHIHYSREEVNEFIKKIEPVVKKTGGEIEKKSLKSLKQEINAGGSIHEGN